MRVQSSRLDSAKGKPDTLRIRFEFIIIDRLAVPIHVDFFDLLLLLEIERRLGFLLLAPLFAIETERQTASTQLAIHSHAPRPLANVLLPLRGAVYATRGH